MTSGGTVIRSDPAPVPGIPDQVTIGVLYNTGGLVQVMNSGSMLEILGTDGNGRSYWQQTSATAQLQVDAGANITAAGKYQIDIGTVQLTAPGQGSADELDGTGLIFGDGVRTFLAIVDATPMFPGRVTVLICLSNN